MAFSDIAVTWLGRIRPAESAPNLRAIPSVESSFVPKAMFHPQKLHKSDPSAQHVPSR